MRRLCATGHGQCQPAPQSAQPELPTNGPGRAGHSLDVREDGAVHQGSPCPLVADRRPWGGPPVLPAGLPSVRSSEKEYSLLETSKIQAACGLTDAQWATDLPELYPRMLEEGRTKVKTKALLEDIFWPDDDFSLSAVQLNVTDEMAKDVKDVNFGYNNDLSYESCHRGISPFAVIGISMAMASKRRRVADRFSRTSNLTLAEVSLADTTPDPIPTGYHGMVNLLRRYVGLLQYTVGDRCGHHTEVRRIASELCRRQDIFEGLEPNQIAS
jgi:hypothetical protein